ncbi:MAG TPA: bifunctional (p)ppGpp synthetase/guanosine-3',5'-bis(diphosphate) 3'-pyrophosphohydrolase [Chloroflexota bacterium]|nr:bifunctional (p)ppGpp synthetase/guanosine-3',5'-bis(diphosphate) 3'-pyrophosphohydrolase [Chloroflexota bacterium]
MAVLVRSEAEPAPPRKLSTIDDLLERVHTYLPQADLRAIRRAYDFAARAHEGQRRGTGEPYVQHPLETAMHLADLQLDLATIQGALLHDVPEDTETTLKDVEDNFGTEVARLVDGVTKLSGISWESRDEQQAENLRKMFLAMAEDIRVVLIKLCDRLHNVQTLDGKPAADRVRIARETLDIYAPLAHRLGIWELKWRLEDGAFRYLVPEKYQELKSLLNDTRQSRERYVTEAIEQLNQFLREAGFHAVVTGRPKHIYSIYNKMQRTGRSFDQLYDLLAIRVLVDTVQECYGVLGVVHSHWTPIPGQFDDYIAMPKGNMYQSLHTAVIGPHGRRLEVQIRTEEMHQVAEHGIAAHWRYKEGGKGDPHFEAKMAWLRQLMVWQQELSTAQEFVESVKMDIFHDEVFVFTPKGEVKDLPAGATPLDFAYRIHTDIGHRCIGARVNGKLVPLDYELRNGDIVEILTSRSAHGPSRDWLNLVRTAHAREKIRQWFKQQQRAENIVRGKDLLDKELRRLGLGGLGAIPDAKLAEAAEALKQPSVDILFATIGYGGIGVQSVVTRLGLRQPTPAEPVLPELPEHLPGPSETVSSRAINVMGVGDLLTRMATCCKPVPGDPIIGFITRGKGIAVHRADCRNVLQEDEPERLVPVEWGRASLQTYPVTIRVEAFDREGLLRDVSSIVTEEKLNITGANVLVNQAERTATILATVEVNGLQQLSRLMTKLEQIKDVTGVWRDARTSVKAS